MDAVDLKANRDMSAYFTGLSTPCPSNLCDGTLSEFDQESWEPFKAFLFCPKCESRLRLHKKSDVPLVGGQ